MILEKNISDKSYTIQRGQIVKSVFEEIDFSRSYKS